MGLREKHAQAEAIRLLAYQFLAQMVDCLWEDSEEERRMVEEG